MTDLTYASFVEKVHTLYKCIGIIKKDGTNDHQKYKYPTAANVMHKVQGALAKSGLIISKVQITPQEISEASASFLTEITITDGTHSISMVGAGSGRTNKAMMIAGTVAYRNALISGLCIPCKELLIDAESTPEEKAKLSEAFHLFSAKIEAVKDKEEMAQLKAELRLVLQDKNRTLSSQEMVELSRLVKEKAL